ncbi:unnamed protein product, partial [Nesidiocoris tenuis]
MVRLGKNAPSLPSMRLHSSPGQAYICGSPLTSVTIPIRSTSLVPVRTILASRFCRIAGLNMKISWKLPNRWGLKHADFFVQHFEQAFSGENQKSPGFSDGYEKREGNQSREIGRSLSQSRVVESSALGYVQTAIRALSQGRGNFFQKRKKEESAKAREQLELLKKKKEAERANALSTPRPIPAPPTEHISNLRISPVPNITGELYPNLVALDDEAKAVLVPPKPLQLCVST